MSEPDLILVFGWSAFFGWRFGVDQFASLDRFAGSFERRMPAWLQEKVVGNPITWVQHAFWCAFSGGQGGIYALALALVLPGGDFSVHTYWHGFTLIARTTAFTLFFPREVIQGIVHFRAGDRAFFVSVGRWWMRVGWVIDGIMDMVGPVLVSHFGAVMAR